MTFTEIPIVNWVSVTNEFESPGEYEAEDKLSIGSDDATTAWK
jgi:hypothetical protein